MGFPERLERAIAESGKSQSDLARETGIAQSSISAMTRGERKPYLHQAVALARALGRSVDWLAEHEVAAPGLVLTPDEEYVIRALRGFGLTYEEAVRRLATEPGGKGVARVVGHADESEAARRRAVEEREKRRLGFELERDVKAQERDSEDGPSFPRGR